jgi:uncharacterized RDD family membrane protein YckC
MSTLSINTTQNVQLKQNLASVGQRILGVVLDYFFLGAFCFIAVAIYEGVLQLPSSSVFGILLAIIVFVYPVVMEAFTNGQTFGKRIMGTRVVKTDGTTPAIGAYLLRWLLLPLDLFISAGGLALLLIIFTKKAQRLGDLTAGTTVVREGKNLKTLTEKTRLFADLNQNYEPQYLNAATLSTQDYELINRSLQAFRADGNRAPIEAMQKKMEQKLQLGATGKHPIAFLEALLKDYTYFSLQQARKEGHSF